MAVAYVAQEHGAEVTSRGTLGTRQGDLDQRSRTMPSKATHLLCISEAGPCGYWLDRDFTKKGDDCWVVAPSLIPKKPGDRVKTTRRDAMPLARLARSGELTTVYVPRVEEEALRDLTRAREDTRRELKDAQCRLNACVLRQDICHRGRANGGPAPLRGLSEVVCQTPAQPIVFQEYGRAVHEHPARRGRLEQERQAQVKAWRLSPGLDALQALRGVQVTVAVTMVAAMGDCTRVENPRERRKFLGLVPSEYSTGERRRQGAIPKAGNTQARRVLVEGAWADQYPANVSRPLPRRLETQPTVIQDISWKAQVRLGKRYRRLVSRGKHANVVTVAMARELAGCMWAIATQVPLPASVRRIHRH
jgi:transposase